jgi:glutamate 5-kinase
MATKLRAARLAARSGTCTVIASGREPDALLRIRGAEQIGTLLTANQVPLAAHKQWLAGHLQLGGKLMLDEGAVKVLKTAGKSLLAVGVTGVEGQFGRGEVVACLDSQGREIARGLVNYSADEVKRLLGQSSEQIEKILGYVAEPELIHRDDMVVF